APSSANVLIPPSSVRAPRACPLHSRSVPTARPQRSAIERCHSTFRSIGTPYRTISSRYWMARGWESKAVESQQADREAAADARPAFSAEDRARQGRRASLVLARARAAADLAAATQPAHRATLEAAIRALDEQIQAQ